MNSERRAERRARSSKWLGSNFVLEHVIEENGQTKVGKEIQTAFGMGANCDGARIGRRCHNTSIEFVIAD